MQSSPVFEDVVVVVVVVVVVLLTVLGSEILVDILDGTLDYGHLT